MNGVIVIAQPTYRLSRVYSGGQDYCTWNRVILYSDGKVSSNFVEGFAAHEMIVEGKGATHSFRKQTLVPQMFYQWDELRILGDETLPPQLRSRLSLTPAPAGFDVGKAHAEVFSVKLRDIDAAWGELIEAFNSTELGTDTGIEFYDRTVRRSPSQRTAAEVKTKTSPVPRPAPFTLPILKRILREF